MKDLSTSSIDNSNSITANPKAVSNTMKEAIRNCHFDVSATLISKMNDHHDELEERFQNISFLNKITGRIQSLTDDMGSLKKDLTGDLNELKSWLHQARDDLAIDFGDIDSLFTNPTPLGVKTLSGNVRNAIDEQRMRADHKHSHSQALQQQFHMIMSLISEAIKKFENVNARPAASIRQ